MRLVDRLRKRAKDLGAETYALYLASRHPDTPWYAKAVAAVTVAYAFSPIDLIPDFIPVLGYLDDLVLVPMGIALSIRLIPADVMGESRRRAAEVQWSVPASRGALLAVIATWIVLGALLIAMLARLVD